MNRRTSRKTILLSPLLLCLTFLAALSSAWAASADEGKSAGEAWPLWEAFVDRFIQEDGRVIDLTFDAKSTSEGQSYALFFALVANQPDRFETILDWTSQNLAGGQLGEKLPAWHWGEREDGSWGIKDPNAASDSDLWIAYALLEAARLWSEPRYETLGKKLLETVSEEEIAQAGEAGPILLPGPYGFRLDGGRFRINPSYLPGFMFDYFAHSQPQGPWKEVWDSFAALAPEIFSEGVAPDLFIVDREGDVRPDSESSPTGSYDAIRVYLWAGMSKDDHSKEILTLLKPFAELVRENDGPPEKVNPLTGEAFLSSYSPPGFSGALLPFLKALDEKELLAQEEKRIERLSRQAVRGAETHYYDQALILFGEGWLSGRYRFDARGRLQPAWHDALSDGDRTD